LDVAGALWHATIAGTYLGLGLGENFSSVSIYFVQTDNIFAATNANKYEQHSKALSVHLQRPS